MGTLAKMLRKHSHGHGYVGRSSQPSAAGAHRARLVPESALVDTHQRDRERPELKLAQIERPHARLKRRRRGDCALEARFVEHDAERLRSRVLSTRPPKRESPRRLT